MTRILRIPGLTLWAVWVVAGALGGALATVVAIAVTAPWLAYQSEQAVLAYMIAFAAVAAIFQYLVLQLVAPRRWTALLWLPATAVAIPLYLWLDERWFITIPGVVSWFGVNVAFPPPATNITILDAGVITYPLALGVLQGFVLAMTVRRWSALALWIGANLVGLLVMDQLGRFFAIAQSSPQAAGFFVIGNFLSAALYAIATGVALVLIVRPRPRAPMPSASPAVVGLQGEG